ncbi:hypothetical protein HanRHA438_Chr09g0394351 [Helianthus annuus]|nr:hypothetical protein HanRHA438_Chr09g0394351 [Helianthus annuus]
MQQLKIDQATLNSITNKEFSFKKRILTFKVWYMTTRWYEFKFCFQWFYYVTS